MSEVTVYIKIPECEATDEFYQEIDQCMDLVSLSHGEFCMEQRIDNNNDLSTINWESRSIPNMQRSAIWTEYKNEEEDFLWLTVFYSDVNKVKEIVVIGGDEPKGAEKLQQVCLLMHRTFGAISTQGFIEGHKEAWFHFSKNKWRHLTYPDLKTNKLQIKALTGTMVYWETNAPLSWPTLVTPQIITITGDWGYTDPKEVRRFAEEMQRNFNRSSCDCCVKAINTKWESSHVEVPIVVQDGDNVFPVFLYAFATEHTASHFASIRELFTDNKMIDPVYFCPFKLENYNEWITKDLEN